MSTVTEVNPRLLALTEAGVSVWLDQIRRSLVTGGELARMVREECLRGVTANPSIFEKAILGSRDYDEDLEAMTRERLDAKAIYERLAIRDVQMAADVLAALHRQTNKRDGFVSLEVSPELAHDTDGTLAEVRDYWRRLERTNVMIKVPGTPEGVLAIEQALYEGINVNVTLLFAVAAYEGVADAYIRALERRRQDGLPLDVNSVASFFVSRVDTNVDRKLAELGRTDLAGRAAIANARLAYRRFKDIFTGPRWEALRHAGAAVQRPLWASTSTKDPRYRDTMYVEELVGAHTVNTMPLQTLLAVADHGEARGATAKQDPGPDLAALAAAGIDMDQVTDELLVDGVTQFEDALRRLLDGIEERRSAMITRRPPTIRAKLPSELQGPIAERVGRALDEKVAERIWRREATLWGAPGVPEIEDRLGWLTLSETMLEHAPELQAFAQACRADGLTDAVLLGMGGSSLGPEVIRRSFREIPGGLRLHVIDSTHPDVVLRLHESVNLDRTLFIVSSKSGTTLETLSHYRHFREHAGPDQFVVITDPGTPLAKLAMDNHFRRCFLNPPDVGGRYSVLSYFGLVPVALMGVNIEALVHRCQVAEQNCAHYDSSESNSGLWLGAALGEMARCGRDKLTFIVSPPIESFGLWVEQLIAASTGKRGRGILPVVDEPLAAPGAYGNDRVIVYLRNADEPLEDLDEEVGRLAEAGLPTLTVATHGPADLGRIFFLAEFATAVAGWALEINPFDQPNVVEAKENTMRVLATGSIPQIEPAGDAQLRNLLAGAGPPRYVAITGFLAPSERLDEALTELRAVIRSSTGTATTVGYGPRFLHSTGQLHKGGPPTGRFLQLVDEPERDAEIPGAGYTFGTLIAAQAAAELEALRAHGLTAERVKLEGEPAAAVRALTERISGLVQGG
ncbi:MAG TPA: bifunctional transaldolase/phosoglucose isomerase [Solirubrobacteraceae bacterium]|nr:bifunctional transaldolase/phosoglucose isomerase [Solirubrobacteraceae bacterium]